MPSSSSRWRWWSSRLRAMVNGAAPLAVSQAVRRRLLEPHHVHDADGLRRHRRLRRRQLSARSRLIEKLARCSENGPGAVGFVAVGQHARVDAELGAQPGLRRPAGACAGRAPGTEDGLSRRCRGRLSRPRRHLGDGSFVLGRAAAGEPRELPKALLPIMGVIPFSETIFLWQSMVVTVVLSWCSVLMAILVGARTRQRRDRAGMGIEVESDDRTTAAADSVPANGSSTRPLLTVFIVALALGMDDRRVHVAKSWMIAISGLNTYNLVFLMLGPAAALAAEAIPQRGRPSPCRRPPAC